VAAQLTRDNVFVQFLEDRGGVVLVGVDDTVDRTGGVLDEKVWMSMGVALRAFLGALGCWGVSGGQFKGAVVTFVFPVVEKR